MEEYKQQKKILQQIYLSESHSVLNTRLGSNSQFYMVTRDFE